jgi:hypothetical protein
MKHLLEKFLKTKTKTAAVDYAVVSREQNGRLLYLKATTKEQAIYLMRLMDRRDPGLELDIMTVPEAIAAGAIWIDAPRH